MGNFISLINKQKYVLLLLLFLLSGFSIAYAINTASTGYQVTGSVQTINVHSNCRIARTTSGSNVFAPTLTAGEWSSFVSNHPANVTLTACAAPCTPWVHNTTSTSNWTEWYVFKRAGSFRIWWEQDRMGWPVLLTGTPSTATSYVVGSYRYERGAVAWEATDYASYYVRRCPI